MRRKKVAKTVKAKKTKKTQAKKQVVMSLADKMEKQFKEIPKQLVAQCRKELATIKQQKIRLSTELKKAIALSKAIKSKCNTLAKAKPSATVKKQLAAAKQGQKKANDAITAMSSQTENLKKQMDTLANKQSKYTAISKELTNIERNMKNKTAKPAKKSKKKTSSKSQHHDSASHQAESAIHEETMNDVKSHDLVEMES